ncbi:adenylate kinase [Fragilaria crotonensis]|nr:adenylate kinase [Fragilaria crotonensis]
MMGTKSAAHYPVAAAALATAGERRVSFASSGALQKSDTRHRPLGRPPVMPEQQCRTGTDSVTRNLGPSQRSSDRPPEFSSNARMNMEDPDLHALPSTHPQSAENPAPPGGSPHKMAQGKLIKLMDPEPWMRFHPFVATLEQWSDGVPVACSPPWTQVAINTAVARGPHTSALTPDARQLVMEEMAYQVAAGFSEIVLWSDVQALQPEHLKVSPLAVIPQVGRRGRLLLDLSFAVQAATSGGKRARRARTVTDPLAPSVNDTTTKLSPAYPVKEVGRVLVRLLRFMAAVPAEETINFAKIDLSDGFWRMLVADDCKWNFAYTLPGSIDAPTQLVIPHALQMGWTESPGYFCAATETGRDIMQALIDAGTVCPPHALDAFMIPETAARRQTSPETARKWQMSAVYVDDYILAAVEDRTGTLLQRTGRAALHTIHGLFPPPARSGHLGGKDPISAKKLEAGDAQWAHTKELLGFVFNGKDRTVHLTQRKAAGIADDTAKLLKKNRAALQKFQSIVGKMRHVTTILPAARGLFTPLNRALRGNPKVISLSAHGEVRAALLDLRQLVLKLADRPTHVNEILLHGAPAYIGYCDASGFGAGGVWFSGTEPLPETVWRLQWPRDITAAIISESNPTGKLTNSDLEMAAVVLHLSVLESVVPSLRHKHIFVHSDNTPSVAWVTKMATKTAQSDAAHRLVRGLALRQRMLESAPVSISHVAGTDNVLADIASRPIPTIDDDSAFLTHFDSAFPLQNRYWRRASPLPVQLSNVILTLRGQRLTMQRWILKSGPPIGGGGTNTAPSVELIRGSETLPRRPDSNYCWALPHGLELDILGREGKLLPKLLKKPCVTWHKPSCWKDTPTHDVPLDPMEVTWLCPLPTYLNPIKTEIQPPVHKLPSLLVP